MTDPVVTLREVTRENVAAVVKLETKPQQRRFVATNANSLAEAYVGPERAWPRAIYHGDDVVGFLMLALLPGEDPDANSGEPECWLWRLMVAAEHQGRGYGAAAVGEVIEHVRGLNRYDWLGTSYVPGDSCPEPFYRKLGFEPTGVVEHGEVEMKLDLQAFASA